MADITVENGEMVVKNEIPGVPVGVETITCDAFPHGVPLEIYAGGFDHRQPYGDETILFERSPDATQEDIDNMLDLIKYLDEKYPEDQ